MAREDQPASRLLELRDDDREADDVEHETQSHLHDAREVGALRGDIHFAVAHRHDISGGVHHRGPKRAGPIKFETIRAQQIHKNRHEDDRRVGREHVQQ